MTIKCEGVVAAATLIGLTVRFQSSGAAPENATVLEWNVTAPRDLSEIKRPRPGFGAGRRMDRLVY